MSRVHVSASTYACLIYSTLYVGCIFLHPAVYICWRHGGNPPTRGPLLLCGVVWLHRSCSSAGRVLPACVRMPLSKKLPCKVPPVLDPAPGIRPPADQTFDAAHCRLVEAETGSLARPAQMPPNRLMTLLEQAVAFQIESGRYHPKASPSSFGCLPGLPPPL